MKITKKIYGTTPDGDNINIYTLSNDNNISAEVINYGGTLTSIRMPDKNGKIEEITLGFDSLEGYLQQHPFFGVTVGRFANRIGNGKFELEGKKYKLAVNDGANHLHGGLKGFDKVVWQDEALEESDRVGVILKYTSKDGEEGYPGTLQVKVIYSLNDKNELKIEYYAETDKKTPVNLTNHAYWNLKGAGSGTIRDHQLTLNCSKFLPVNEGLIPTGEVKEVTNTPMDFTKPKLMGKEIDDVAGGYDHCFVINRGSEKLSLAAKVYEPSTGRVLEISTTKPAIQFYSGNFLDNVKGKEGKVYPKHGAFCLETEYYPDAVNKPNFPSAILSPGEKYFHETVHKLYVE